LQSLIVFQGKRFGQPSIPRGEVLAANQAGLDGVAVGGQILQQTADVDQVLSAGLVAQWRILFAQATKPAQQMRIAAELRQTAELRKSVMEIAEKTVRRTPVGPQRAGLVSHGEAPDMRFEDLVEVGFGRVHGIGGRDKRVRFSMARAYSRHTSWGASWTYSMVV